MAPGWRSWWTRPGEPTSASIRGSPATLSPAAPTPSSPACTRPASVTRQASLACARTGRLELARLERGFDATHTTSPAGSILASIEGSLSLMAARGEELLGRALGLVREARRQLQEALGPVGLPDESRFPGPDGPLFDPLRLVVQLAPLGADGRAVEGEMLRRGVAVEYADRDLLAPVVTLADDRDSVGRLVQEIVLAVGATVRGPERPVRPPISWRFAPRWR